MRTIVDNNQANATAEAIALGRRMSDLSLAMLAGPGFLWARPDGLATLRRWSGTKYPVPYMPELVGHEPEAATSVTSATGATYANDTVYWHIIERFSPSGIAAPAYLEDAVATVWGTSGYVGAVPNTPTHVRVVQVAGPKAMLTWQYNPVREQVTPATFEVFSDAGTGTMDWTTVVASVDYVAGITSYAWRSGVLAAGGRQYSVRAKTAGGVYSLAPLVGDLYIGGVGSYVPPVGTKGVSVQVRTTVPADPPAPTVE